jgi:hypothetical protein
MTPKERANRVQRLIYFLFQLVIAVVSRKEIPKPPNQGFHCEFYYLLRAQLIAILAEGRYPSDPDIPNLQEAKQEYVKLK